MNYLYTAWFTDANDESGEKPNEWPACIIISASSEEKAIEWGDQLAQQRLQGRSSEKLIFSSAENTDSWPTRRIEKVPRVEYGDQLATEIMGW